MGRHGEAWGGMGRHGEPWGGIGRHGEAWGAMGRHGDTAAGIDQLISMGLNNITRLRIIQDPIRLSIIHSG